MSKSRLLSGRNLLKPLTDLRFKLPRADEFEISAGENDQKQSMIVALEGRERKLLEPLQDEATIVYNEVTNEINFVNHPALPKFITVNISDNIATDSKTTFRKLCGITGYIDFELDEHLVLVGDSSLGETGHAEGQSAKLYISKWDSTSQQYTPLVHLMSTTTTLDRDNAMRTEDFVYIFEKEPSVPDNRFLVSSRDRIFVEVDPTTTTNTPKISYVDISIKLRIDVNIGNFIILVDTRNEGVSSDTEIRMPVKGQNMIVDWGIGSPIPNIQQPEELDDIGTHYLLNDYGIDNGGQYPIKISSELEEIRFANTGDRLKATELYSFGHSKWATFENAFYGCENLTFKKGILAPDTKNLVNLKNTFRDTLVFNGDVSGWDVSSVKYMDGTFQNAQSFNIDISGWNTVSVENMQRMFKDAHEFNQPLTWTTNSVKNITQMFKRAYKFNYPINNWNVNSVTEARELFNDAREFNQELDTWNLTQVEDKSLMFRATWEFNQDLGDWDISQTTKLVGMFEDARKFNSNIEHWNTQNVTDFSSMFNGAMQFNHNVGTKVITDGAGNEYLAWDISLVDINGADDDYGNMQSFLNRTALTIDNLNKTIISYANRVKELKDLNDSGTITHYPQNIDFGIINLEYNNTVYTSSSAPEIYKIGEAGYYDNAEAAVNFLVGQDVNWNIIRDPFRIVIDTEETGVTTNTGFKFTGAEGQYDVAAYNMDEEFLFTIVGLENDAQIDFESYGSGSGQYILDIIPTGSIAFNKMILDNKGDKNKLITVLQFGQVKWNQMVNMFYGAENLNLAPNTAPDLTNVTSMTRMFYNAKSFNQSLDNWDVSNITSIREMFGGNVPMTSSLKNWDLRNVTSFFRTFYRSYGFNGDISEWQLPSDPSINLDMTQVFQNAVEFNGNINNWDVSRVDTMVQMFSRADAFNQPLDQWDVSSVTNMTGMFYNAKSFNQSLDNWDVSNVTNFYEMFRESVFNQQIQNWDINTTQSVNMSAMFYGSPFNQPLDQWDVSSVTSMNQMFSGSQFNQPLNQWDVSSVTDMSWMFYGSPFNQPLNQWDVSSVTNMRRMFYIATSFNQPLNEWDVSSVTDMVAMFRKTFSFNQPLDQWDVSSVTSMNQMFSESSFNQPINTNFIDTGDPATSYTAWDVSSVTNMGAMFYGSPFNQPLDQWDVSSVTNMIWTFYDSSFNQPLNQWDVSSVTSMRRMFRSSPFNQPLDQWDVSSVTNMEEMFRNSPFNQPLDQWNVSSVTNMRRMFTNATSFNQPLDQWDVSSVTDMIGMFTSATSFNQDIGMWDTSSLKETIAMFRGASSFNADISNWDVSSVTVFSECFMYAEAFNQNLGKWDVSGVSANASYHSSFKFMFRSSGMSPENMSKTLIGWVNRFDKIIYDGGTYTKTNTLGSKPVNNIDYSAEPDLYNPDNLTTFRSTGQPMTGQNAVDILVNVYEWTIVGE